MAKRFSLLELFIVILIFILIVIIIATKFASDKAIIKARAIRLEAEAKVRMLQLEAKAKAFNNAKSDFEKKIVNKYDELMSLYRNEKYQEALNRIEEFDKYSMLDYKDVKTIIKKSKTILLERKTKKLPSSDIDGNFEGYKELLALNPSNPIYKKKYSYYSSKMYRLLEKEINEKNKSSYKLEIISSSWHEENDYATYVGQVKNISNAKLDDVEVVVTWYDKNGQMITYDSALIKYNPIMPGQTSPFEVNKSYNPLMYKAEVEFKYLFGGTIRTTNSR